MTRDLTPYDTNERAEPVIWVVPETGWIESTIADRRAETDDWGKVDFDDDSGATLVTIWVEPNGDGAVIVHVSPMAADLISIRQHRD